jgi:hypothetical protein
MAGEKLVIVDRTIGLVDTICPFNTSIISKARSYRNASAGEDDCLWWKVKAGW